MSAQHTPGPWAVIGTDPSAGFDFFEVQAHPTAALRGFTKHIASADGHQSDPERRANACLIAAAPELLEALEYLVSLGGGDCLDSARAAIAKARGEA